MRHPFISVNKVNGKWYHFDITFRINLKVMLRLTILLAILAAVIFTGYWLVKGTVALAGLVWNGLCWLAGQWLWFLGAALLALLIWALTKINWSKDKTGSVGKYIIWIVALIAAILCIILCFRSCNDEDNITEKAATVKVTNSESFAHQFDEAFDFVVTTRAYLDGVQTAGDKINRALVGLKYVDGQPVSPDDFSGKTYDEAKEIISKDWRTLVGTHLAGVELSRQQLVTVTLFAMRNGKYGFEQSDFLKALQDGRIADAEEEMSIHKASGEKRELRTEAQQYLWVLKNLWRGNLSVEDLLDFPMFSYKTISLDEMYDGGYEGELLWNDELYHKLKNHSGKTPREALDLN